MSNEMDRCSEWGKHLSQKDFTLLWPWLMSCIPHCDSCIHTPCCWTVKSYYTHTCPLSMCLHSHKQDSPTSTIWVVIPGRARSIPQVPAPKSKCVCVCVYLWGHEGRLRSRMCQFQSGPSKAGHHRGKLSAAAQRQRKRPPSAALRVKSLCVYSHDGSRPHCDVLFMAYQFIMTRPVPTVKTCTRVCT